MKRNIVAVLTCLALPIVVQSAWAQTPRPGTGGPSLKPMSRPTVSPYLDLVAAQEGRGLGYQYYRQFLPQQQFRQGIQQNRQAMQMLGRDLVEQDRLLQSEISGLTPTGLGSGRRAAAFMTHDRYFSVPGAPR